MNGYVRTDQASADVAGSSPPLCLTRSKSRKANQVSFRLCVPDRGIHGFPTLLPS